MQSRFVPGVSTINQLTFLYNTVCGALDLGKEVRVVFCDISNAFDRVWHTGLIVKLKVVGVNGPLLSWFSDYLQSRTQCRASWNCFWPNIYSSRSTLGLNIMANLVLDLYKWHCLKKSNQYPDLRWWYFSFRNRRRPTTSIRIPESWPQHSFLLGKYMVSQIQSIKNRITHQITWT